MFIEQISVFVENKPGSFAEITDKMAKLDIKLHSFTVADTMDFGVLRIIAEKPSETLKLFKEIGLTANITKLLCIKISNNIQSICNVSKLLTENEIEIDYIYSFSKHEVNASFVFIRVSQIDKAHDLLTEQGYTMVSSDDLNSNYTT